MHKSLLVFFVTISFLSKAQTMQCSSDEFNSHLLSNAENQHKLNVVNNQLATYLMQYTRVSSGSGPLIVPVVFHVIHQNGPENVSDSVLQAEIDALNQYFSNSGTYYQANGVDIGIQFCLASVDPYGNPTNGITRNYSSHAVVNYGASPINDIYMKNVNRWNPYRYLNIWIVKDVLGFANAYSSLPIALGTSSDGIVLKGTSLGGIHYLITHEAGHYLGLNHHYVSGNCNNGNCLLDGDNICDVPPELEGNTDCNISTCSTDMNDTTGLSPFTSNVPDMGTIMSPKQNCSYVFTQGQADRMNAALTQIRNLLLSSNACGNNTGGTIPIASFSVSELGCNSTFFDYTGTAYEYIEWDYNEDGYFETTQDSFGVSFTQSGFYTIVVHAFGSAGGDADTQTVYVHARPTTNYPLQSTQGAVSGGVCHGSVVTFTAVPGMVSYLWSNGDTTQSTTYIADSTFSMTLTCIDSTGYVWQRCPNPTVIYPVFAPIVKPPIYSLSGDSLCYSDTLIFTADLLPDQTRLWWIINGFNSMLPIDTFYIYHPYTEFNTISMLIKDIHNCNVYLDTVVFHTDLIPASPYIPYYFNGILYGSGDASWHHQFYLNGNAISGADSGSYFVDQPGCYSIFSYHTYPHCGAMSDTLCFWVVGENELSQSINFHLYPNPVNNELTLTFDQFLNSENLTGLKITNLLGEEIAPLITSLNPSTITIDTREFASGIYHLSYNGFSKKFIKINNY